MASTAAQGDALGMSEQLMQLDQAITLALQEIDENFSQAHQVVTSRILPAVREYEVSCARTWANAQFWKRFFEASAQVSLSQQPAEELETTFTEPAAQDASVRAEDDTTTAPDQDDQTHLTRDSDHLQSPPRLSHSMYAPNDSDLPAPTPFERLKHDVEQSQLYEQPQRHDAPLHASDVSVSVEDSSIAHTQRMPFSSSPLKARAVASPARTQRRLSARPRVSIQPTDQGLLTNPFSTEDSVRLWNGIADLRKTPLRGQHGAATPFRSPSKVQQEADEHDSLEWPQGMSPPVTMQFSVSKSKYANTPAKDAAKSKVDDLVQSVSGLPSAARHGKTPAKRRQSVVGTPLTRRTPSARRDSLPTPPTITKVHNAPPGSHDAPEQSVQQHAGHEMSPTVSHIPGMLDKMLALDDDNLSDEENATRATQGHPTATFSSALQASSTSRSIEDDTLFGMALSKREPNTTQGPHNRSLSGAVRRTSEELRLLGEF
ncbi:hypothetical protein MVES1_000006 [Malassezia vespertilionis]|uniref:DASH complex subunit ASK1 n=1 Tax=Malassezia vespertilionis TaxID=2020962 RepID=A0A2N1JGB7_9BASI|nr:uncharacterized protein MVES1_000006 [Malassezia vespertilionis]PKI85601.1 Ask1p [Malassezia vespertilionis]WFD04683.1 hypothetical protein MVES1_000006 [Malassezia vespertilionis]